MLQGERTEALVVDPCTSQDTVARVACEVENLLGVARDTLDTVSSSIYQYYSYIANYNDYNCRWTLGRGWR